MNVIQPAMPESAEAVRAAIEVFVQGYYVGRSLTYPHIASQVEGIGSSLLEKLLRDDRKQGVHRSVLLASHAGASPSRYKKYCPVATGKFAICGTPQIGSVRIEPNELSSEGCRPIK